MIYRLNTITGEMKVIEQPEDDGKINTARFAETMKCLEAFMACVIGGYVKPEYRDDAVDCICERVKMWLRNEAMIRPGKEEQDDHR